MKLKCIIIGILLNSTSIGLYSQFTAKFEWDDEVNGIVFKLVNSCDDDLENIKVTCYNIELGQKSEFIIESLPSGESDFLGGEEDDWIWQPGEYASVQYGEMVYSWKYTPQGTFYVGAVNVNQQVNPNSQNQNTNVYNSGNNTNTRVKPKCGYCNGTGNCPYCNKKGQSLACVDNMFAANCTDPYCIAKNHKCKHCGGTHVCSNCHGNGSK
jgi:hypothetical protein